jgi:transcriptional regulator with XRE-family HTH domain
MRRSMNIAAGKAQTLVYTRVVADARRGLTVGEIGGVTGVSERAVQNWAAGKSKPEGGSRERLLELKYVIEGLADVYEDEGIEIWLHSRQRSLGGQSPLELLKGGRFAEVLDAIDRLAGGPKR